jgi:dTDP-glucose pyrophosphorylase
MKAVITAAGKETRMRPVSHVVPKTLLPLFKREDEKIVMVPLIDWILSEINSAGIKDVCIVVGNNTNLLRNYLEDRGISFAVQEKPIGFGDAVLSSEKFVGNDPFLLNVGDIALLQSYREAIALFEEKGADCVVFIRHAENPSRYGVVTVENEISFMNHKVFVITGAEEKPKEPKSEFVIVGVYIFKPEIFGLLRRAKQKGDEAELTPAMQGIIDGNGKVYGILINSDDRLNAGDPSSYHEALNRTFDRL